MKGPRTWMEFVESDPSVLRQLRAIVAQYTKSDRSKDQTYLVFNIVFDALDKAWPKLEDKSQWTAYARSVARRQAPKLRLKTRRRRAASELVAMDNLSSRPEPQPLETAEQMEELQRFLTKILAMPEEDRVVLCAFANSFSGREAAEKLGIPEATYRIRIFRIIKKIQRAVIKSG